MKKEFFMWKRKECPRCHQWNDVPSIKARPFARCSNCCALIDDKERFKEEFGRRLRKENKNL